MENKQDLLLRIEVCKLCLRVLEETDDPRVPDAIENYTKQLEVLQKRLAELDNPNKPEDIVINLKPALLFGKVGGQ